jgi:hypothetical protein
MASKPGWVKRCWDESLRSLRVDRHRGGDPRQAPPGTGRTRLGYTIDIVDLQSMYPLNSCDLVSHHIRGLSCACSWRQRRRYSSQAGTGRGVGCGTPARLPSDRLVHRTTNRQAAASTAADRCHGWARRSAQAGERSPNTGSDARNPAWRFRRRRSLCDQLGNVGGGAQLLLAFARADLAFALCLLERRVAPVSLTPAMKATSRG